MFIMRSFAIPIQQLEARTQIVLSEQAMDSLARLMVDRLIQTGILEERQLEEYRIGTSELGKNLRELSEKEAKANKLLSHEEIFGESL